jgi:triosephosphate isomerase
MPFRPKLIAGNWKMNKDLSESVELVQALKEKLGTPPANVSVVVCPPFTSLAVVGNLIEGTSLKLGAQNMSERDDGAFTGEISWRMLRSVGCEFVILGHSERRQYFGETNELVNQRAKKALAHGLHPIICVGEKLEERESGIAEQVVGTQVKSVLRDLSADDMTRVVIAYEPVWAIGTGKNATPLQAQQVHQYIRKLIGQQFPWVVAERTLILYGGSVKPDNSANLLAQADIDGALVGGACLEAESFISIVRSAVC